MEALLNINGWHWLGLSACSLLLSAFFWRGLLRPLAAAAFMMAVLLAVVYVDVYRQLMWATGFLVLSLLVQSVTDAKRFPANATKRVARRHKKLLGQRASVLALQTQKQGRIQLHDAIWTVVSDQPLQLGELVEVCSASAAQVVVKPCARGGKLAVGQP